MVSPISEFNRIEMFNSRAQIAYRRRNIESVKTYLAQIKASIKTIEKALKEVEPNKEDEPEKINE